jgi:hypothetical protein
LQTTGPGPDSDQRGLEKARHDRESRECGLTDSRSGARRTDRTMTVDSEATAPPSEL